MVPSARNVEITARPCSFAPSWAASSRVVMCSPFVPCLRLKGSSFWLTLRKGHDLIAVLTTGSLRSYCPVSDPLRTPVDRGEPIPQSGRRPSRPCHARDPPLLPTCITMHRRSPAKLPDVCRDGRDLPMCGHPLRRGRWCRGTADRQRRSKMTATLRMTHKAIGVEVRRGTYDIVVDGQRAGSLEMNDTIEIPVEPGRHTLQIRSGRNSSRTQTFEAAESQTVAFRCTGKSLLPIFLASFVVPSLALQLRREADDRSL